MEFSNFVDRFTAAGCYTNNHPNAALVAAAAANSMFNLPAAALAAVAASYHHQQANPHLQHSNPMAAAAANINRHASLFQAWCIFEK